MNKRERLDMIDRLQSEIAATTLDMAERSARDSTEEWTPPSQRKPQQRQAAISNNVALANTLLAHADQHVNARIARAVDLLTDIFGEETGRFEKALTRVLGEETARNEAALRKELIRRQDDTADALRIEVSALRGEIADLRDAFNALAEDVASLQQDVGDIEVRNNTRKIVAVLPRHGGHHG
ncbi:hypothetical protein [Bradyrhizobium sp. Bra64]|uniref:hypothetical protein n=1 Tax=Bradyrhizobium sp. Bra64 TaxID=2926009 RepID=UPI00211745BF|nr:hypothetical protein [Bradyrhizobium sp. Bra64]